MNTVLSKCIFKDNKNEIDEIKTFLHKNNLIIDEGIDIFIVYYQEDRIIACGGLDNNIIKCIAIDDSYRGENILLSLATELITKAYELNRKNLFIYTKPEYQKVFKSCGFYLISDALPYMVLLENSKTRLEKYCNKLSQNSIIAPHIGSIVMNANPFTLGHRYLVEFALTQCDFLHIFVVGENASTFSYDERFSLVEQGIADLRDKICLHKGSEYIISKATFPNYFIKDQGITDDCYAEIDLKLFREHIAPALHINQRFVAKEPFCPVTAKYNQEMHYWLEKAPLNKPAINVIEIERKAYNDMAISASYVRKLIKDKQWDEIQHLVPKTTFDYLLGKYS